MPQMQDRSLAVHAWRPVVQHTTVIQSTTVPWLPPQLHTTIIKSVYLQKALWSTSSNFSSSLILLMLATPFQYQAYQNKSFLKIYLPPFEKLVPRFSLGRKLQVCGKFMTGGKYLGKTTSGTEQTDVLWPTYAFLCLTLLPICLAISLLLSTIFTKYLLSRYGTSFPPSTNYNTTGCSDTLGILIFFQTPQSITITGVYSMCCMLYHYKETNDWSQ